MREIQIIFDQTFDGDLIRYFSTVDEAAKPYVAKQLIRLALTTNVSPFIKLKDDERILRSKREIPQHPQDPVFSYDQPTQERVSQQQQQVMQSQPVKKFQDFKPPESQGQLQHKAISREERIAKLNKKIGNI